MSHRPITPTRIIPAGAPLPDRGPLPGELPPWWRTPAPAAAAPPVPPPPPITTAPPPAPAPAPLPPQVHVHVVLPYEPEPEPTRRQRLWAWVRTLGKPWQLGGAIALTVLPIPGVGYSVATIWAYGVSETRAEWGQGAGYALALTPLTVAVIRITTGGGTLRRLLLLAVSLVGLTGAIHLYDPITWITGVRP
ncbi:hypothetical protein [Streptomyces sp. AM 2-1-1]|uniref:hypothetical protein n=1 Tax=Streptomyces sp. AM 2-1-1 TaxID=3028709 RepID=UPI0023BA0B12|nr:hypothetical protein [Streptomyces sp. AM 2-1-1]WEH40777.1 hypothetical protein PZB77_15405 [Streptomyces sp. AM 2-1-1]